jgi:hypothetical protein
MTFCNTLSNLGERSGTDLSGNVAAGIPEHSGQSWNWSAPRRRAESGIQAQASHHRLSPRRDSEYGHDPAHSEFSAASVTNAVTTGNEPAMQIKPTPLIEAIIESEIAAGRFATPEDVILQALRCLQNATAPPVPEEWLAEALAQVDSGETRELTEEVWNEIREQARENARLGKPISDEVKY